MANLGQAYDTSQYEASTDAHDGGGSYEPMPTAWYIAQYNEDEYKENKKGTGMILTADLTLLDLSNDQEDPAPTPADDGWMGKRKAWARFNMVNPSERAVEISRQQFASLCGACNVEVTTALNDTAVLYGQIFEVYLTVKPESTDGKYKAGNDVNGFRPASGAATPAAQPAQPAATPPAGGNPWDKK